MKMSELLPYANRLHFPGEMEKLFRDDYFEKSIATTRLALLLGIALVTVFSLLDFLAAPAARSVIWAIRFGVICPAFGIVLFLSYRPIFRRWMQPLISLAVLTGGLGIAAMSAAARPTEAAYTTYYAGLILVIMWGYTFIRLRFWYATLTGWIIVAGYQVVAIGYQHLLTAPMGLEVFVNNNFFFVTANILGMCAAYFIERYARLDFLQRRVIEDEKLKSEQSLQKEAADALRESEARFRTLIEISANGIIIIDPDTRLTYASPAFERMTGYPAGELVGQPFMPLIHPDDLPRTMDMFARLVERRESRVTIEYRTVRRDGAERIFEGTGQVLPNGHVVGFIRDITERKQSETALRAIVEGTAATTGNDFFCSLVQHLATALDVRHAFVAEVSGQPPARVRTLAFWSSGSIAPNLEYALPGTPCENVVAGSVCYYPQNVQASFPTDLDLVKLEAESYLGMPLIDSAGNVLGHVAVLDSRPMRDETRRQDILKIFAARVGAELERQQAEEKLRQSEEYYRSLIENSSDSISVLDTDGTLRYISPALERILGYSAQELVGHSFEPLIEPDELPNVANHFQNILAHPGQTITAEVHARHKDGSSVILENVAQLHPNGKIVSNSRNITERKQAEEALRESEERFRTLVEISTEGIALVDAEARYLYVSPAYERLSGYTQTELIGQTFIPYIYPDDLPAAMDAFTGLITKRDPIVTVQLRFIRKDGVVRFFHNIGKLLPNGQLVAYISDITERKQLEEQLRASEEYFRSLIENASDGIAVTDPNGIFTYVSPSYERIWGWTADELLGRPFLPLIHPDDIPLAQENIARLMTIPGYIGSTEIRVRHKDDSWRLIEGKGKLLPTGSLVSNVRDVTERRKLEDDLRRLNEALEDRITERTAQLEAAFAERTRLAEILEATSDLVAFATLDGRPLYLNRAGRRILGLADEVDVTALTFADFYPPEVLELFETVGIPTALREGTWSSEVTVKRQDGHLIPVSMVGIMHRAPDGTPSHLSAIARDIGERKRAEEALQAALTESRRLATIIEAMPDYVGIADLQGWSLYINQAGRRLVGKPDQDDTPWNVANCYPPEELPRLQGMFEAMQHGQTWAGESTLQHMNGSIIPVEQTVFPLHDTSGNIESYAAVIRDIGERKRAGEELQAALAESKRLAAIIENTSDFVAMAHLQGSGVYLNRAGRRMFGFSAHEDLSSGQVSISDFYPAYELEKIQKGIEAALRGEVWSAEIDMQHPDGYIIPVSEVGFMIPDADGNPEYLATIVRDISEQKRIEAELQAAKESAEKARHAAESASRAKSTFLANMSHEIRTPMNAVIGMTGLLLNTSLNDKQRDFVETIRTSGDTLLTIINDILDFSKIEAGKMELVNRPFDLRACIESVLDLLAPKAVEKGLDLAYFMEDDVPAGLSGDDTRLRQILVNLVGNAIKFTDRGEVLVSVSSVKCQVSSIKSDLTLDTGTHDTLLADTYELHFAVRDTGIGIPVDKLDSLFHSFSQIDPSSTRHYGGTGLGLAISRRLAELMGGTMWVESEGPGRGTTFHFTLVAEAAPVPVRHHLSQPRPELSGKRVLVVDDNATNRRILSLQLQNWGMLAQEAAGPMEALELLRQHQPFDLALLDMNMPDMDGASLAMEMCHLHGPNHFPLVMLTSLGYQTHPDLEALVCFAAYLTKPVKPSQLYDTLVSVLAEEADYALPPANGQPPKDPTSALLRAGAGQLSASPDGLSAVHPLRILLAEDVQINQKFALLALEEMGYRADVAANGLEVLAAVTRQPYDAILMDVQMPEMDGLEATRRICEIWAGQDSGLADRPASQRPYIIAMTANALQGDREICLEAGMDDYISKPVYLEELRSALERAERSRRPTGRRQPKVTPSQETAAIPKSAMRIDQTILDKLLQRPSGPQLIAGYLNEAQAMVDALRSAVTQGDTQAMRAAAHSLKGSSSYVGAVRVAALSFELEQQGRQGVLDGTAVTMADLVEEFEQFRQTLNERLNPSNTPLEISYE